MEQYKIIIGVDCGLKGGITIFENDMPKVYPIPVKSIIVNKKNKKVYDVKQIVSLFEPFYKQKVLFVQEEVSAMSGQGVTSMFSFGKSSGLTLGIAYAYNFDIIEVRPVSWKKYFPELNNKIVQDLKENKKKIVENVKNEIKNLKNMTLDKKEFKKKEKEIKNNNKKEIERLFRQIKTESKIAARSLASILYPNLSDLFKKANSDGLAESLLIGKWGKENLNF